MPNYSCIHCKFFSIYKGDYKRHLKTKKHLAKIKELTPNNQNEPKMNQNEPVMNQNEPKMNQPNYKFKKFSCNFCDEKFTTLPSKRRHENYKDVKKIVAKPKI